MIATELIRYGHAPGNYYCLCGDCKERYTGDKRSVTCRACAEKRKAKDSMTTPGATEAVTPEQRAVVSVKQSPMNAVRWSCQLSCGHDVWITSKRRPARKKMRCQKCIAIRPLLPKEEGK